MSPHPPRARTRTLLLTTLAALATALPPRGVAADFWVLGRLPAPHDHITGTLRFKFARIDGNTGASWWSNDRTSKDGSEPKGSLPLRVVAGRYLARIPLDVKRVAVTQLRQKPGSAIEELHFLLRTWVSPSPAEPFTTLAPDRRYLIAWPDINKEDSFPAEVQVRGPAFSSSLGKEEHVVLPLDEPVRILVHWKPPGGAPEWDATDPTTITCAGAGSVIHPSVLYCSRKRVTHSIMTFPLAWVRSGAVDGPTDKLQTNNRIPVKQVTQNDPGSAREWTNLAGLKLPGILLTSDDAVAVLRGADGNLLLLDRTQLSPEDQAYLDSTPGS